MADDELLHTEYLAVGAERDALQEKLARLQKEYGAADAEITRFQQWVEDLQAGMFINCVYCGHRYGPNHEVPASMAEVLKKHIEVCPKHPLSVALATVERLRKELSDRGHIDICNKVRTMGPCGCGLESLLKETKTPPKPPAAPIPLPPPEPLNRIDESQRPTLHKTVLYGAVLGLLFVAAHVSLLLVVYPLLGDERWPYYVLGLYGASWALVGCSIPVFVQKYVKWKRNKCTTQRS